MIETILQILPWLVGSGGALLTVRKMVLDRYHSKLAAEAAKANQPYRWTNKEFVVGELAVAKVEREGGLSSNGRAKPRKALPRRKA